MKTFLKWAILTLIVFLPVGYGRIKHKGNLGTLGLSAPKQKPTPRQKAQGTTGEADSHLSPAISADPPLLEQSASCQFTAEHGFNTWRFKKLRAVEENKLWILAESQKDRPNDHPEETRTLELSLGTPGLKELEKKEWQDSEILQLSPTQLKQIRSGTKTLGAWFTGSKKHLLLLEDRTGNGFQLFSQSINALDRAPALISTDMLLQDVGLSPSKKFLSFTTHQWGLTQLTSLHLDNEGHLIERFPVETNAYESLTAPSYWEEKTTPKLFAILHSPDKPDSIVKIENGNLKPVFEQAQTYDCIGKWWRHSFKSKDGTEIMLDVYEPAEALKNKKWVIHVPKFTHPHLPYFEAHRHYWLQNGWVVVEPHLRGTWEKGTDFYDKGTQLWEADIQEVTQWANRTLASIENRKETLWEEKLKPANNLEFSRHLMR